MGNSILDHQRDLREHCIPLSAEVLSEFVTIAEWQKYVLNRSQKIREKTASLKCPYPKCECELPCLDRPVFLPFDHNRNKKA